MKCRDGWEQLGPGWDPICLDTVFSETGGTEPSISADGRYIAFTSASPLINQVADTLMCDPFDENDRLDVYVADMMTGGEVLLQTMLRDSTGKLWATPMEKAVIPQIRLLT